MSLKVNSNGTVLMATGFVVSVEEVAGLVFIRTCVFTRNFFMLLPCGFCVASWISI